MRALILLGALLFLAMAAQTQPTGGYSIPDFQCPAGQFVTGFKSGKPTCGPVRLPAMASRPHGYGN